LNNILSRLKNLV